jgi:hypothetical protein
MIIEGGDEGLGGWPDEFLEEGDHALTGCVAEDESSDVTGEDAGILAVVVSLQAMFDPSGHRLLLFLRQAHSTPLIVVS